ncbi:MAG: YfhO family protein [Acidobacteria bacterium]|nr:YfhO family protein [Acidobacteriota bacterium]
MDPALAARAGLVHVADLAAEKVYENTQALPRFFLVGRLRHARSLDEAAARLRSRDFDPRVEAVVEGAFELGSSGGGTVQVIEYALRRVALETDAAAPAFLVTSETHYPGWRVRVDGREQPIYYTNVAFRGLAVPAGRHRVEFEFTPSILWPSAVLSFLALLPLCPLPFLGRLTVVHSTAAPAGTGPVPRAPVPRA